MTPHLGLYARRTDPEQKVSKKALTYLNRDAGALRFVESYKQDNINSA